MAIKVVSRLVATLELDTTKLQQGVAQANAAAKQIGQSFKQAAGSVRTGMGKAGDSGEKAGRRIAGGMNGGRFAVLILAAAVTKLNNALGFPALKKMTQDVVDSETKTLRLAETLRLNTTELQAWQKVVQVHGGTSDSFNSSLEKMSANLGKLGTQVRGAKLLQQYLDLAGVTDAMVQGRDALGVLRLFADQMGGMTPSRQLLVGRRLGLDDATIRSLQEGGAALEEEVRQARSLAAANRELQNAREVAEAQAAANLQWERAKQVIAQSFLPVLKHLTVALKDVSKWVEAHQEVVKAAAFAIGFALAGLAAAVTTAATIIVIKGALIAVGMTAATGGAWAAGVAAGIAALAALGLAVGDLAGAFDHVTDAHSGMVDEIINGDKKIQAAAAARRQAKLWAEQDAQTISNITAKIRELQDASQGMEGWRAKVFHWLQGKGRGYADAFQGFTGFMDKDVSGQQRATMLQQARILQSALDYAQRQVKPTLNDAWMQGAHFAFGRNQSEAERIAAAFSKTGKGDVHVGNVNIYTDHNMLANGLDVEIKRGSIVVNNRAHVFQTAGGQH